jgi:hypothetical protein
MNPAFDTAEWIQLRDEKLMEWIGDPSAVDFIRILGLSTELFDDLVDRDRDVSNAQIFNLMISLWVKLPFNSFWNTHKGFLMPILLLAINAWQDANVLEKNTGNDKVYAYVLRNLTLQILPMVIFILHGEKRMRELSLEMHRFFTEHETFEQYDGEQ